MNKRYVIPFQTVEMPTFKNRHKELLAYEYPLRVIVSDSKWPLRCYNFLRVIGWYRVKFFFKRPKPEEPARRAPTLEDELLAALVKVRAEEEDEFIMQTYFGAD